MDWLPENLFGLLAGFAGAGILHFLVGFLPLPVADPIPAQYAAEFAMAPLPTAVLVLVLIPVIEEALFRGLVFGSLRRYSRVLAYVVTILGYALACVWRYAIELGDPRYLLLTVCYLPMSAALTWCYDNGGSIWGSVGLHTAINAFVLALALH